MFRPTTLYGRAGPPVNIFCEHPNVSRFSSFEDFLQEVRERFWDANPPTQPGAELADLLERARKIPVTPSMRAAQIRSFAYGSVVLSNSLVTPELIDREADELGFGREA